jgi:exodeoxyribonuclease-1
MSSAFIRLLKKHRHAVPESEASSVYDGMPASYRKWVSKDVFLKFLSSGIRETIFWHDYEAGGTHAKSVPPMQFAGLRTTKDLEVIDEPCDWYCRLAGDRLPHPQAVAITKINPKKDCQEKGHPEPSFFRMIHAELAMPNTCVTGYNSLGYDEEVTRFGFWRNLIAPYAYAFENGNSRWDLMNVVAAYRAFSPNGVAWPKHDDGRVSLKLEDLARENGVTQENAHNAMDDVIALIGVAKKLRDADEKLWETLWALRKKKSVKHLFFPGATGLVASPAFGSESEFWSPVVVLGNAPGDSNKFVCVQLSKLDVLRSSYKKSPEELREQLFSKKDELEAKGVNRLPVFTAALNKCPVFLRSDQVTGKEISPDMQQSASNLLGAKDFVESLKSLFSFEDDGIEDDPAVALYSSGFPSDHDAALISSMVNSSLFDAFSVCPDFQNPLYSSLWVRAQGKLDGHEGIKLSPAQAEEFSAYCLRHRNTRLAPEKHEEVSDQDVHDVLRETEMPEDLKRGYLDWLKEIQSNTPNTA